MKYLLFLLLFCSRLALAGDAAGCIEVGTTERGQSLKNTCQEEIVVFWCHNRDQQGFRSGLCGATESSKRFYKKNTTLEPGKTTDNYYSLPANAKITYGACFGGYGAYKFADDEGGYLCKPPKGAADGKDIHTVTASAPSAAEACNRAQAMAREGIGEDNDRAIGQCACQARGNVNICRVQFVRQKAGFSAVGAARKKAQEFLKCKPEDKDCVPLRGRNVGTGRRG
jgi:hypothetical protein